MQEYAHNNPYAYGFIAKITVFLVSVQCFVIYFGEEVKMVIPIKKAPLKANNNLILLFCVGLSHNTRQAPITIERKGRR